MARAAEHCPPRAPPSRFETTLLRPSTPGSEAPWTYILLPKDASASLPRRGRTTVDGSINGCAFQATLEPDGQLSHWLRVSNALREAAGVQAGDVVTVELTPALQENEPEIPPDFQAALTAHPEAHAVWNGTTTIARVDWIHWITSAKQAKTRVKRITDACQMLASGKARVCCFDPSGYYSKALSSPLAADENARST